METDVYISPPSGYTVDSPINVPSGKRVCFKLNRGLYGLKQSGRLWHETLKSTLADSKLGYKSLSAFPSTFVKCNKDTGKVEVISGLFVDDMIIAAAYDDLIDETIHELKSKYLLKEIFAGDNGANKLLGVDVMITRDDDGKVNDIKLNQGEYIKNYFDQNFENDEIKRYNTPLPPNYYFNGKIDGPLYASERELKKAQTRFRSAIGTLLYMSIMTRPDITYAVNYLARFAHYPHPKLVKMLNRVICYTRSTFGYSLHYIKSSSDTSMTVYTDSDYAQDPITRKSMNGFMIYVNGNLVYWKSKHTLFICTSSMKAEQ